MRQAKVASGSEERGAAVRFPPPLIFLGSTLLGIAVQLAGAAAALPVPRPLSFAVGAIIIVLAVALGGSAVRLFHRSGQNPAPWTPSPTLVLDGPYRFTRNPMYTGFSLLQLGIGIAANNVWIALLVVPTLLCLHVIAVVPEETHLAGKFGKRYEDYRASVRRYL